MSTPAAFLAGVPSVNIFNTYPSCVRFIGKELFKLGKVPFVQILALFFAKPYVLSNSAQFFKRNHRATVKGFYDSFCNHMVAIGSKTVLLVGNLFKVSFGRFATTGLQRTSDSFITLGNFFNTTATKELIFRSNGNFLNPPVNTHNLAGGFRIGNIFAKNHIQKNFTFSDKQISGTSLPCKILVKIFRNKNGDLYPACNSKQRKLIPVKPYIVTSGIISDRRLFRFWAGSFLFFLYSCLDHFNRFSGLHPSGYSKLRREVFSRDRIGFSMQGYSVRVAIIPSCLAHEVKCLCVFFNRWLDNFYRDIEFEFYSSYKLHIHILNTIGAFVKRKTLKIRLKAKVSASLLPEEGQ